MFSETERYIIIAISIAIVIWGVIAPKIKETQKKKKRTVAQKVMPITNQQIISTSIKFPGTIRSEEHSDTHITGEDYELSEVSSIVCQDALGQQLSFDRLNDFSASMAYREVTYTASDLASKAIQMAMPAGQQLYTVASLARMAPHGLFTATVDPAQLSHFLKDGTYTTMIHGPGGVTTHAGFKQIPGLSGFNPVAIVTIAFQAMAMISGNHYMVLINKRLSSIEDSIQEIMTYNTDHDLGILSYAQRRLIEITSHSTVTDSDMDDIRDIKRDVGKLYDQYRIMYSQQKENVRKYKAAKESADKRMSGYYAKVRSFLTTSKVCATAYQIYLQAALTEICVSMKRDVQRAELENMINDAANICNMRFEDVDARYDWIQNKAQKILDEKNFMENLMGIDEEKKRQLLAPVRQSTIELREFMNEVANTEVSEKTIRSMQEKKRMLLIPGENGAQPRIFIPISA